MKLSNGYYAETNLDYAQATCIYRARVVAGEGGQIGATIKLNFKVPVTCDVPKQGQGVICDYVGV